MDFDRFRKMKELVMDEEFFLSYSGFMSEDILEAVGQTLRERLEGVASSPKQIRQVFSIFVELMQNIIRYGDDGPQQPEKDGWKPSYGMLTVSRSGENIVVISGNYISQDQAQRITERMLDLQGRSQEELRQLYKEKLRQPAEETSKGASLGLIEIARRSKMPPEFEINDEPDGTSFFIVKASA